MGMCGAQGHIGLVLFGKQRRYPIFIQELNIDIPDNRTDQLGQRHHFEFQAH